MKHALSALALAVLVTGCPKKEPQPPPGPVEDPAVRDGGAAPPASERPREEAGPSIAPDTSAQGGDKAALETCVDRWLQAHKLDPYGHEEGTMYAGGSPLFNEATGERRDRLEYVFARQPDARKACEKGAQ